MKGNLKIMIPSIPTGNPVLGIMLVQSETENIPNDTSPTA